ncbi:MAG: LysM peptidoglycan-binding domain-containing protein [Cyclobacteriaceae bacterium]
MRVVATSYKSQAASFKLQATEFRLRSLSIYLLLFLTIVTTSFAQTVPKEMDFGGMQLHINESARRQIQKDVDRLTASQTYYGILVDRMNLYFPIIERAFKENNIPDEIKFLAIQESALISDAVSVANAVGFWQFKDFTAREVDLKVDRSVDERLNITSASYGSAKYLNTNNFFYDNWIYAVMAYNTGRGGAEKYVDKTMYGAKKMTIDAKTHWYVKKFLAHVIAFSPSVGLPHSENLWLDEEKDAKGKTMADIARKHKVDLDELKKYNKWLKRGTVPSDKQYTVLVPKQGAPPKRMVAKAEDSKPAKRISEPVSKIYPTEIKPGITRTDKATIIPLNGIPSILSKELDDVHSLSARAGVSEAKFRKYNDMGPEDGIIPSEFYYVKKKKGKSKIGFHVTKKGETLWDVSQQYGIQLTKLARKNGMSIIDELKTGRVLWLKKTRPSDTEIAYHRTEETQTQDVAVASANTDDRVEYNESDQIEVPVVDSSEELKKVRIHTVAPGESLWAIAQKYDVLMEDLLRWNELENPDALGIGQNVRVKAPVEEVVEDKKLSTYRVEPGDTLYGISRKYNMSVDELMELNKMSHTGLAVGELLRVYDDE